MTKKVVKKHGLHPKKPTLKKVKKVIKEAMKVEKKTAAESRRFAEIAAGEQPSHPPLLPAKLAGEVVGVPEPPEIVTVKIKGRAKPYNDKKARMPAGTELRQGYDGENWHGSLTADGVEVHASNRAFAVMVRGLFEAYNERINPPTGDSA